MSRLLFVGAVGLDAERRIDDIRSFGALGGRNYWLDSPHKRLVFVD